MKEQATKARMFANGDIMYIDPIELRPHITITAMLGYLGIRYGTVAYRMDYKGMTFNDAVISAYYKKHPLGPMIEMIEFDPDMPAENVLVPEGEKKTRKLVKKAKKAAKKAKKAAKRPSESRRQPALTTRAGCSSL